MKLSYLEKMARVAAVPVLAVPLTKAHAEAVREAAKQIAAGVALVDVYPPEGEPGRLLRIAAAELQKVLPLLDDVARAIEVQVKEAAK